MRLNCDLGEGLHEVDAQVMPHIHMANIACGGHAGDTGTMQRCVALAVNYGVQIGAHPGYEDRESMGRKSLHQPLETLQNSFRTQVLQLADICDTLGAHLSYIKPHGALYNDMMQQPALLGALLDTCQQTFPQLPLLIQGVPDPRPYQQLATEKAHTIWFEGFADRRYTDAGFLVARDKANAVYEDIADITAQAASFAERQGITSENGHWLPIRIDTLCVHGDTPQALEALLAISHRLQC